MTDLQRYNALSWEILRNKVLYYRPSDKYKVNKKVISDDEYDALEMEYLGLCKTLGKQNTLVHKEYDQYKDLGAGMMEIDLSRPCVKYMIRYLRGDIW